MKVAELMQTNVQCTTGDSPISQVLIALADSNISGLPVLDASGRLVGVISSTDVIAAQAKARSPDEQQVLLEETRVEEIMTPRPLTISPTADVRDAARHMLYADVRRLFIEDEGALVGVISQTDIVQAVATGKIA
jgi:CBS domain-containing protein